MAVPWPEDDIENLQAAAIQHRLHLELVVPDSREHRRLAVLEGFRLHADTAVHAHDRQGLAHLCKYGSRGPIAESRLKARVDGRYEYRTKRGPVLVLTAARLVKQLLALLPPRGRHLTTFHGVFAPNSRLRAQVIAPAAPVKSTPTLSTLPPRANPYHKRPRLDWAALLQRTFGIDISTCRCGGKRKVLALVTRRRTAEQILKNLGLLLPSRLPHTAQGPPQLELQLSA